MLIFRVISSLSVLSRIMAEMGILSTTLGAITIATGVCNDLIGYILLALGSALGTGGKQIDALYQLLSAAGYIAALWFLFRPTMFYLLRRSGFDINAISEAHSKENKVPPHLLVIAICGALVSAFFTDAIGVHPIVGAFSFGVVCPHGAFALQVTESVEMLTMGVLLPLYFVTSGLSTDFKLLNDGTTWGLIFLMLFGIFISKFGATALSARLAGLEWRQACCVASLMQSKGIIEIIILNVGKDIGVVSPRVFAMLVICFLSTTMLVRPLSRYIYFSHAQQEGEGVGAEGAALAAEATGEKEKEQEGTEGDARLQDFPVTLAITSVNPSIAAVMSFLQLVGGSDSFFGTQEHQRQSEKGKIIVDLIRLLPQDYSTSDILRLITASDSRRSDDMLQALKMHASLCYVPTSVSRSLELKQRRQEQTGLASSSAAAAGLSHTFTQHHDASGIASVAPPPADTFPVPTGEMIPFITKCNKRAQRRLDAFPRPDEDAELGAGIAVVAWERSNSIARGLSWLGTAATAAGLATSFSKNEENTFWRVDRDAQALPNRLFAQVKGEMATGVLVEPHYSTKRLVAARKYSAAELEKLVGLERTQQQHHLRRPRVFVPFFGGSDDRAAVELVRRIALAGRVDAIVVVCGQQSVNAARAYLASTESGSDAQLKPPSGSTPAQAQEEQETINLRTIYQAEADHADVRFLFAQQGAARPADHTESGAPPPVTPLQQEDESAGLLQSQGRQSGIEVRVSDGIRFIYANTSGPDITAALELILPLLDTVSDFVFVGRGKLGQRPKDFRDMVDELYVESSQRQQQQQLSSAAQEELRLIGRSLGAAAEGLIVGGLHSSLMVVQSKRRV